jgi:hypothetical protein
LGLAQVVERRNVILSTQVPIPLVMCLLFVNQLLTGVLHELIVDEADKVPAISFSLTSLMVRLIVFQRKKINRIMNSFGNIKSTIICNHYKYKIAFALLSLTFEAPNRKSEVFWQLCLHLMLFNIQLGFYFELEKFRAQT